MPKVDEFALAIIALEQLDRLKAEDPYAFREITQEQAIKIAAESQKNGRRIVKINQRRRPRT